MPTRRALLATVAAPLLLATALPNDDLSFHPKAGSEVKKQLEVELELKPESVEFSMNGEPMPDGSMDGLEESMIVELAVGVTEKFVEAKDGRPIDLLRTFDELSLRAKSGSEEDEAPDFDRLEGKTVRFHWNEAGDAYERSFHESEGDDILLLNLSDDMDLRVLLPGKDVEEGDTWEVPGSNFLPLFLPGGMPGEIAADEDAGPLRGAVEEIQDELEKLLKAGKLKCKHGGTREQDGTRVAEIPFTVSGQGEIDFSQALESLAEGEEIAPTVDATARIELDGEGKVLWDLEAGRVHAFEMRIGSKIDIDVSAEADFEGESFQFAVVGKVSASGTWKLTTSVP
ncbi:MAG: hypothetical protein ACKVXR_07500 [Planctomycetota bacterium]